MPELRVSRRRFTRWLAAAPFLAAVAKRAWADWDNVATPPVFATIEPPPIKPVAPQARLFSPRQVKLLDGPFLHAQRWNTGYVGRLDTEACCTFSA